MPEPDETEPNEPEHPFAPFIRILGRGPGRSRALTRDEARDALRLVLTGAAEPIQIGAFLMLLRYRGEDAAEIAGLVEAAREAGAGVTVPIDLDWPSYGAGRTRRAPWFLLAALALAQSGRRILMHGSNAFSCSESVGAALVSLGLRPAVDRADAAMLIALTGFAYLPIAAFAPALDQLLGQRRLLGLRSPINTVARLLDPFDAPAGIDGVFHPAYIETHLATAERLKRPRLLLVKGGGGEAERNPAKALTAYLYQDSAGRSTMTLPALTPPGGAAPSLVDLWQGLAPETAEEAVVTGTIALALLALEPGLDPQSADRAASEIWASRRSIRA
jgi:anthranilate phosphoribosyltransferase